MIINMRCPNSYLFMFQLKYTLDITIKDSKYWVNEKTCIKVNTRELDKVPSTNYLSYIY